MNLFEWTQDTELSLREQISAGASFAECAVALSKKFGSALTKGMVAGKVDRLGINHAPRRERRSNEPAQRAARTTVQPARTTQPEPEATDLTPDESLFACTIEGLGSADDPNQCRFPLGMPAHDMLYCGAASVGSWCPRHKRIVYQPRGRG